MISHEHLKSAAFPLFVQQLVHADNKKITKLCITGPLWGDSTSDLWIPGTNYQLCGQHIHVITLLCLSFLNQTLTLLVIFQPGQLQGVTDCQYYANNHQNLPPGDSIYGPATWLAGTTTMDGHNWWTARCWISENSTYFHSLYWWFSARLQ